VTREKFSVDQIALELMAIFNEHFPLKKKSGPMAELYRDLGMGGDDADEFLTAVGKKYNIDMSHIETHKYFPDEGAMISDWPFKLFRMKSRLDPGRYESINFNTLAQYVAEQLVMKERLKAQ
jgi:Protein of unknown function (DUF1493)